MKPKPHPYINQYVAALHDRYVNGDLFIDLPAEHRRDALTSDAIDGRN